MRILRVFNNNVVLAADDARGGEEVVLTGRGLGFQAHPGDDVDPSKVVRTFVPQDGRDPDHTAELVAGVAPESIALVVGAMTQVGLPTDTVTLVIALADHVGMALSRHAKGVDVVYPLEAEVRHLYPEEFARARDLLAHVNARVADPLPDAEAVALALHLVNAGFAAGDLAYTYRMTGIIQQILDVVAHAHDVTLAAETVNVGRFITHLRYLFVRIREHSQLAADASPITRAIAENYPLAMATARRIADVVELRLNATLTPDEIAYLAMHVDRVTTPVAPTASSTATERNSMISLTATVGSSVGLHARPAGIIAEAADALDAEVTLAFDGEEADAASVLEIMTLGAKKGDVVTVSAQDESAQGAVDEIAALIEKDLDA